MYTQSQKSGFPSFYKQNIFTVAVYIVQLYSVPSPLPSITNSNRFKSSCSSLYWSFTTNRQLLLGDLGWNTLTERRTIAKLSLSFKAIKLISPGYKNNLYVTHPDSSISLNNPRKLSDPKCRTERFKKSFVPSSITLWKSLDSKITSISKH